MWIIIYKFMTDINMKLKKMNFLFQYVQFYKWQYNIILDLMCFYDKQFLKINHKWY